MTLEEKIKIHKFNMYLNEMANDMYTLNNKNIKDCIQNLKENINVLMDSDYAILAKNIKDIRQNLYNKEGKNIYN